MSCHRHAARSKQHYFLLACQSGTFFENNASKPTIKSRFSSDSRLKRALISAPATVSFCSAMFFSNEIFLSKISKPKQSYAKKRQPLFSPQPILHNTRNSKFEICSKLIFLYEKISKSRFQTALLFLNKNAIQEQVSYMTFLQPFQLINSPLKQWSSSN